MTHAADCPACRPIAARYQTLRQATRAWRLPPAAPAELVHQILSAMDHQNSDARRSATRQVRPFSLVHGDNVRVISGLAATVLVCAAILGTLIPKINSGFRTINPDDVKRIPGGEHHAIRGMRADPDGPPALDRALAEATSATWDLARSASEPAARIGREVLDVTARSGRPTVERPVDPSMTASAGTSGGLGNLSVSFPSLDPLGSDAAEASALLQQVGDHLSAGVQPLSSTARHAFGFLLGPPAARAGSRPVGSTSSGA